MELKDLYDGNFYHVCTDGNDCQTLMKDESDYSVALNYLALCSWRTDVRIASYCIMSNHFHFIVMAVHRDNVDSFIALFKKSYAMYFQRKYTLAKVMKYVMNGVTLIHDVKYLQNCVAYVLRNPVSAGICARVDEYPWSSYGCYFSSRKYGDVWKKVSDLNSREMRLYLRTDRELAGCPFLVDRSGCIIPESFVMVDIIEHLFRKSGKVFLLALGICRDSQMEYELTVRPVIRNSDLDIVAEADRLAARYFSDRPMSGLSSAEKCRMVKSLFFNYKSSVPQLSRVLGLPKDVIKKILGT